MRDALVTPLVAGTLLQLHLPRTLGELRAVMDGLLARVLPAASVAVLVEDQNDGRVGVELTRGAACPLTVETRVAPHAWQPAGLQRRRLLYRGLPIGEVLILHEHRIEDAPDLLALLDHYAAALANLKLDTAALAMVDHYCAGQQAFAEGVVLFQEQDRAVTAARLLQLVSSLLHANHGTLLTYARVGDTGSELLTDQLLGVPEELMTALRAPPDWAAAQVDQPARLLQREDDGFPPLPSAGPARVLHSIVTCPLRYHGITAGVALVFNVDAQTPELPLKLATLNGLGELGAALLHRSQLEREAVFAKGLETQLAIAATIQTRLLPSAPPRNGRWTYAWRSRPSQSIGGDYLDLFDTPDQGVCAVVADVSGHGIDSALLMTSARAHFRAVAGQLTPAQALARLNDEVHREVGSTGMFVTGAALRLAGDARSLVFASAGHNPILVYRAATRAWQWLESSGPPLGFVAHAAYLDRTVDVAAGDIVVLYSDGITEAVDAQREEMFGEERLAAAVAQVATCPPDEILAHVLHMVEHFTSRSHFDDDASLVVLKA